MNTTRKERFIQKATRLTVKVLLFSLLLFLFLYACIGAQSSVAYAADNNFRTNPHYNDYISGFTSYPGKMSTAIEYISVDSGLTYDYIQYSSGKKTWTGKNGDYYHGWYITFEGRAYYAIMNGAISSIKNKITPTGSGGVADEKRVTVYGSKPSTNGDYGQGFLATNGSRATMSKSGGIFNSHELQVDIEISGATVASGGTHDSTNKRISYYMELFLSGGTANSVETFSTDAGAWLDVYIGDASDPYNNSSSGVTIKAKDDGAGIYSVKLTLTHDIYGNDITDVDCGTYYSSGSTVYNGYTNSTKEFAYTATKAGKYSVTVTDNVGNEYTFEHTVPKSTITLKPNYPTSAGVSASDVVYDIVETGTYPISDQPTFICPGYAITGWSDNPNATSGSNQFTVSAMNSSYTLYAVWIEAFTLIYENGTGDSVTPVVDSAPKGTTMTIYEPPSGYTKVGHYFAGWKFRDDGTTIQPGATITAGENATSRYRYLDAIWNPITYSITYQGNGNTGGSTATQTGLKGGEAITIQTNGFTKDDGFFMHWEMTSPYSATYDSDETISANTMAGIVTALQNGNIKTSEVSITLKAIWLTGLEFGKYASGTGQWGSATNPYVIRTNAHLNNLSLLTNGARYVNVNGGKLGSIDDTGYATYTDPVATARTYSGCYFELAADINTGASSLSANSFANITYTVDSDHAGWGNNNEKLTNITDGNPATKFCDGNMAAFTFRYDMSAEKYVDSFTFTNASDAENVPGRIPQQFIIKGSTDGSNWVTVCNVIDSSKTWSSNSAPYTIKFSNPGYYRYFQVYVKSRRGFEINGAADGAEVRDDGKSPLQFADLWFNGPAKGPSKDAPFTPIGNNSNRFKGHFDGNEHTVTYAIFSSSDYVGLFGYMQGGSVRDLTVAGEIFATGNYVGGIAGCAQDVAMRGTLTNNATITGNNSVGGILGFNYGANTTGATLNNAGNITGVDMVGGYAGEHNWGAQNGTYTNSGTVIGTGNYVGGSIGAFTTNTILGGNHTNSGVVKGIDYVGGIVGGFKLDSTYFTEFSITENSTYKSTGTVVGRDYVGGIFGYLYTCGKDITIKVNVDASTAPASASSEAVSPSGVFGGGFFGWIEGTGTIKFVKGSKITGEFDAGESTLKHGSTGNIVGGVAGVNNGATLDFSALDAAICTNTMNAARASAVKINIVDGKPVVSASGAYTGAFVGGIVGFNNGDIIGRGNGSNKILRQGTIYVVNYSDYMGGIVGYNYSGTISNCSVQNLGSPAVNTNNDTTTYFRGAYVGGIAGYSNGSIENCYASGIMFGSSYVGGIVGYLNYTGENTEDDPNGLINSTHSGQVLGNVTGTFTTSTNTHTSGGTLSGDYVGGLAGRISGAGSVAGCTSSGTVSGASYVGGYVGYYNSSAALTFENLSRSDSTTATGDNVGGFFGRIDTAGKVTFTGLTNTGAITGTNHVGGFVGFLKAPFSATNLTNGTSGTGTLITGASYVGGIFGETNTHSGTLTASINYMKISATSSYIGGIVGIQHVGVVSNCDNYGVVDSTGGGDVGGITGRANGTAEINDCDNYANVLGTSRVGGILGSAYNGGSIVVITNATNSGDILGTGDLVGGILGGTNTGATTVLSGTLTNTGSVRGASYVGGIAGRLLSQATRSLNWDAEVNVTTLLSWSVAISGSGSYEGGVIGYLGPNMTITGTIDFVRGNVDGLASPQVGGANQGGVTRDGGAIGGIFGYNGSIVNATTTFSGSRVVHRGGTVTINAVTGAFLGGIVGYNAGTITNAERAGNDDTISNAAAGTNRDYIGGIAGYNAGTLSKCKYTSTSSNGIGFNGSTVYARDYIGGIAGYNKGTITNCYVGSTSVVPVAGSNYVGGIAGYNAGTINYTAFGGRVQGTQYVGGIAGYTTTVNVNNSFCINGANVSGTSNVGGVVGYSSATNTTTSSWAFYNGSVTNGHNTGSTKAYGKYLVLDQAIVNQIGSVSSVISAQIIGNDTSYDWTEIVSRNIDGFFVKEGITTADGDYLILAKYDFGASSPSGFAKPRLISSTPNSNGTVLFGKVGFYANDFNFVGNVVMRFEEIDIDNRDQIYDGQSKTSQINFLQAFSGANYVATVEAHAGEDTVNVGTFNCKITVKNSGYNNVVFGVHSAYEYQITPFDINSPECHIFYDGAVYGNSNAFPGNNTLIDVTSFKNNLGVIQYEEGKKFYVYRKYSGYNTPGNFRLLCTVTLAFDGATKTAVQNTVSANDKGILSVTNQNVTIDPYTKVDEDVESYFTTGNNYTGELTLNYMVVDSDYGVLESADHSKQWGSAENPYVISHWIHLLRLSEIVNQISEPINSVQGIGAGDSANARSKDVFYTAYLDGTIKKSYFLVTDNIIMPDYVNFKPIGGWSAIVNQNGATTVYSYENNASNYFGGVFDGNFASGAYATIKLGKHFSALNGDYVGLFGMMKGVVLNGTVAHAEVKNVVITTTSAIEGNDYVGSLIGKADSYVRVDYTYKSGNALITSQYNNTIAINGANCVGGVVGYVGLGVEMYGEFVNNASVTGTGNYVGGIIGQLKAGAGRQGTGANAGTYYLGEYTVDGVKRVSSMTNYGSVVGSQAYTGGVIGAMTQNVAPYDGVITVFEPTFIRNEANVTGKTVVGGLVGRIDLNNAIRLINTEDEGQANWSYNGSIDSNIYEITTNTSYAGGLFGVLSTMGHQIDSVFSTAVVKTSVDSSSNEGNYIGGLVGYMNGGTFRYSFVSLPGNQNVNATTDMVHGNNYVGGLVGNMALGTLDTCYVQGFKYDNNLTTARGGVAGVAATVATIKDTWALYLTADPTYQSVPANAYGNYILSFYSANDGAMSATIDEMFVFAGLIPDSAVRTTSGYHRATGTTAGEIVAQKGSISLGITLPSVDTITGYDQKAQVVFYNGSGYEDPFEHAFEDAANDSNEHNLFLRLSASTEGSVIIAKAGIRFGSISDYTNSTAWEEKYLYIGKTGLYKIDVVDHPTDDGNYHRGSYQTSYSFDYSATGNYVKTSRDLTFEYEKYSAVAPRIIASQADWDAFASEVRTTGNANGLSQHVKLATNAVQVNYNNLAGDINATLDANGAIVGKHFAGTFDGDGYYITVNIDATGQSKNNEIGLFPHAANATFQNLTIKGSITTAGDDVGAFVGIARGDLIFENCTNEADITSTKAGDNNLGAHNIGGLVGTSNVFNIAFIDCVNTGDITALNGNVAASANDSPYGVGGIIGQGASTSKVIVLDSCRNSGNITAVKNVGGMIGFAYTKTIVTNCGNSGTITATNGNYSVVINSNSNVGGIIGITDENGSIDVFASYNSGNVIGWGNKAGGIMGADCDYTSSSRQSKIYNCYNTGNIYTGGDKGVTTGGKEELQSTGVQVGGIFGNGLYVDVAYCYNLGTITCNGIAGEIFYWSNRAGGIGGYTQTTSECKISFCYNAGRIIVNDDRYCNNVGAILGHSKDADAVKAVYDSNGKMIGGLYTCYTIQNACHWPYGGNDKERNFNARTNHDKWEEEYTSYSNNEIQNETSYSGIVVDTIADLTAVMNANGTTMVVNSNDGRTVSDTHSNSNSTFTKTIDLDGDFSARGNVQSLAEMQDLSRDMVSYATSGNWNSILSVLNNNYNGYSSLFGGGYVWVYGCLPQLAVFAVDTRNGLAMSSRSFDKDNQGIYAIREAGSEFNPYIVKDGIDLMGINAILQADEGGVAYDFAGEYISFANSTNNLEKDVTTYINLPDTAQFGGTHENTTYGQTYVTPDSAKCFMFSNGMSLEGGKSYHLFEKGAVIADNFVGSLGDQYGNWISKNGGVKLNDQNMIPIGTYRPFAGNFSGALTYDAENNVSSQTEIRGINITFPDAGLFGGVSNGSVKYITLTGTIKASNSGNTATAGIVARATNNAQIVGVKSGTTDRILSISTTAGNNGYTGGIVGMADSGVSGNRLTIANSVVVNATIIGFKDSIGGIVGYSEGDDAASFTDIVGCHVQKATIQSSSTGTKRLIGGIVGVQGNEGALTVSGCHVGTEGRVPASNAESSYGVVIKGDNSFGGIISFAEAGTNCANAFIDCYVWEDVLIKRYSDNNETDKGYGTAIGGIVGYVSDSTDGYATFRGEIEFHGTINVSGFANVQNVGGVVGYMGSSARMEQCFVTVAGTINAERCSNADSIGGFAGISKGVALDGIFTIEPSLLTDTADNVGGFIGLNEGDTYITRTTTIVTGGQIGAHYNVGGFIGANAEGSALHMGAAEYKGTVYGEDGDSATISLHASVDGKKYVGGFLGYNKGDIFGEYCTVTNNGKVGANDRSKGIESESVDCIGGVFGDNSTGGSISISENAVFVNNGQVGHSSFEIAYQEFVGGIIGVALGDITNNGVMRNTGDVYGYEYVGGAIGGLVNGTISGQLSNGNVVVIHATAESEALEASDEALSTADTGSSSVTAVVNVGGVIGIVMQDAKISGATLTNYGSVTSTGDSYNVSNLGGAIGLNYGVIQNSKFYNYGTITAKNFAGGALGVSDGVIHGSNFYNYATITFTGDTALGGSVGYITSDYTSHGSAAYYPTNNAALGTYDPARNRSQVTGSYFGYESTGDNKVILQATGEHPYPLSTILSEVSGDNRSAFVAKGGLGGVFGAINSDDMTEEGGWSNNTFFIYGDVYGGTGTGNNFVGKVDAVGGVIGAIEVSYISINNMVIYRSDVGGRNYVGGIVGYNDSANSKEGAGASIDNCYNVYGNVYGQGNAVGGIVGYVNGVSGPGMMNSNNTPQTNASYWIFEYSNEMLQNSDPNNLTTTLNRSWVTFITDYQYENDIDPNAGTNKASLTEENGLTWKEYFIKKLHPTYTVDSLNNVGYYDNDNQWQTVISSEKYEGNIDVDDTLKNFGVRTWKEYFIRKAGYSINAVDDIGTYGGGGVNYNTGTKATGYYYLFANDSTQFAPGGITVDHDHGENTKLADPYANNESLNYWLLIAGSAKRAQKPDGTYYDEYASDFVHENVDGKVKKGFIYSTGYSATKNGYYLYVKDQGNATTLNSTTIDNVVRVFASSEASSAGNVMIFYRKVAPRNTLVYNGRERYASIIDLNFAKEKPTSLTEKEKAEYFGNYYYTFPEVRSENGSNSGINLGTSAKSHHLKADIWSIDSDGNAIVLGSVDSSANNGNEFMWSIRKRTFDISFESGHIDEDKDNAFRFDGTFSHYIKFTVSNIALAENISNELEGIKSIVSPKYLFNNSVVVDNITISVGNVVVPSMENLPYEEGVDYIANAVQLASNMNSSNVNDIQNCYIYNSETKSYDYSSVSQVPTYGITYLVYFMKAGAHSISVEAKDTNHKAPSKKTASITVNKRDLHIAVNTSTNGTLYDSYTFDGGVAWQGVKSVVISNFITGTLDDNTAYVKTTGPTAGLSNGKNNENAGEHVVVDESANTITVNFYANDAATYNAVVELKDLFKDSYYFVFNGTEIGTLSSGTEPSKWDASWTINKKTITLENVRIKDKEDVYYDGKVHSIEFEGGEAGASFEQTWGNEVIYIDCNLSISGKGGNNNLCNADVYTVSLSATNGTNGSGSARVETAPGKTSLAKAGENNYIIKYSSSGDTMEFEIKQRPVRLVWRTLDEKSFVYSGSAQGLDASDLKLEMSNDGGNNWYEVTGAKMSISGNQLEVGGIFEGETLIFDIANFKNTNAKTSAYEASVTRFANVTGKNAVNDVKTDNYDMTLPGTKEYTIDKATLTLTVTIKNLKDKVFDNTTTFDDKYFDYTPSVTSNGAIGGVTISSVTGTLSDKNVGDRTVTFSVSASVQNSTNYKLGSIVVNGANTASITARPLSIQLNNGANGSIYKTYDDSTLYASVTSDSGDEKQSNGIQWRTGRGILVSNFCTSGVTVTASFLEVDQKNRSDFNAYVNDIYVNTSGQYVIGGTNATDTFYKMLRFALSGEGSTNYYIAEISIDKGKTVLKSNADKGLRTLDLVDTAEDNISIAIKKASVKATYSNTSQSYANPDNSYNTNWSEVAGQISTSKYKNLANVHVENGWMYVSGNSGPKRQYEQYTRIAGSATSTRLGATLTSADGKHLCLTLRNQPTLIIGYFVEKNGGYEIGSMAGLLIASEYFKNNFNTSDEKGYDYVQTEIDFSEVIKGHTTTYPKVPASVYTQIEAGEITTWEQLLAAVPEYDPRGYTTADGKEYTPITLYTTIEGDIATTTDEYLKAALQTQLDSFEFVYELINASGEIVGTEKETLHLVWWVPVEVKDTRKYNSFILVDNIDAILTKADIDMLTGAFGSNYGVGKTYLPNVVFAEAGSVVIFNGPVFDYARDKENNKIAFNGVFNGDGYTIDHLTIMYSAQGTGEHNVGMFAEVSGTGSQVTAINLRNLNIQVIDTTASAKVINVGGVAGKFAASTVMEDVTVHGTISVKSTLGTVYAGGVIGSDSTGYVDGGVSKVIDGAIVVATVRAEGAVAVAGGVIGIMNEVNTTLTDVVSLSEVYAKGANTYANGFVGQYAKLVGGNASYNQDGIDYAPLNSTGKTSAYMNSVFEISADGTYSRVAGGVSYDTLYDGSKTAYVDGIYLNAVAEKYGTYDVVSEKNAIAIENTTGSMRLRDIVDTYVLGYELSAYTSGTGDSAIATYRKSTTSKYVGTADGTADNRIGIAYQQHLNLIRMFNYMNFTLNRNVTMYTGYELRVIDEAFTGTIEANGHEVNVRSSESNKDFVNDADGTTYPQFFAYQDVNFTWLKKD